MGSEFKSESGLEGIQKTGSEMNKKQLEAQFIKLIDGAVLQIIPNGRKGGSLIALFKDGEQRLAYDKERSILWFTSGKWWDDFGYSSFDSSFDDFAYPFAELTKKYLGWKVKNRTVDRIKFIITKLICGKDQSKWPEWAWAW